MRCVSGVEVREEGETGRDEIEEGDEVGGIGI